MNTIHRPSYSPIASSYNRLQKQARIQPTESGHPHDTVSLSGAQPEKRNLKKMALFGGIGATIGVAAAALICPAAGVAAWAFAGLMSGVGGAAIADGALETAGTGKPKPFDPYNVNDILDPDNLNHPRNPYNPLNYER